MRICPYTEVTSLVRTYSLDVMDPNSTLVSATSIFGCSEVELERKRGFIVRSTVNELGFRLINALIPLLDFVSPYIYGKLR